MFVAATYGKGEPTDNAKKFVKWIQSEEANKQKLDNVKYTVTNHIIEIKSQDFWFG